MISSPCPAVVNYIEKYRKELIEYMDACLQSGHVHGKVFEKI